MKAGNAHHPQGASNFDGGYNKDGMHKTPSSKSVLTKPGKMRKKGAGRKNFSKGK
jgi:hypothetical protein